MSGETEFDIEKQWQLWLKRVGIKLDELSEEKHKELKACFYGACGQMLVLLPQVSRVVEDPEAYEQIIEMIKQVNDFFKDRAAERMIGI
jgi:hypothetical protein